MDSSNPIWSFIREILQTVIISLAVFFFFYVFVMQPHRVRGQSMMPNFSDGELLLTEKVSYYMGDPNRGDVIVFKAPIAGNLGKRDFIKRIIGLPGEIVRITDGQIYINDQKLIESYETQETGGNIDISLSEDQYFVLGDNRNSSSDSRTFGTIKRGSVKGRTFLVYFPFNKIRFVSGTHYGVSDSFDNR